MVFKLIDGKKLAEKVRNRLKLEVATLKKSPKLSVILVGDNPASKIYVKNKEKYAGEV
nr:bifunctional methylenetetrahydrofolate dehydrogenase/methenyltetrahydrofolate cyclohydrolase [bacterium]